jgi:methyl-accepting chemotaxis protein
VPWLNHLSIRYKLLLLVGVFSAGLVLLVFTSAWALRDASRTTEQLVNTDLAAVNILSDVRGGLGNMRRFEKDLFLNLADETELLRYHQSWQAAVSSTVASLTALQPLVGPAERAEIDTMLKGIAGYRVAVEAIQVGITRGEINDPWAANKKMTPAKADVRAAEDGFARIATAIGELAQTLLANTTARQSQMLVLMIAMSFVVLCLSLALGWLLAQRIAKPLESAAHAMEAIADGDLTGQVEGVTGTDEMARMLSALQRVQQSLNRMVTGIRANVSAVELASSEIASGNQDLSTRTEQAASNLQETAASMEQLTSTVRQSADSARQANQLAVSVSEIAVRGGHVVGQVVTTMNEINASSKKISDIIGVIDGIAFQTNILALNAAVEAARAGEQGRGFAVVAAEVRSLAQRSAEAAKEIKGLIGSSVDRVEAGSRLVAEAGQTMSELVGSVQRVSDIIGEITAAAGEQSDGIGQVNVAVNQLDQMTQQNAALVEESAAAAESLKDQAVRLNQAIAVFRTTA